VFSLNTVDVSSETDSEATLRPLESSSIGFSRTILLEETGVASTLPTDESTSSIGFSRTELLDTLGAESEIELRSPDECCDCETPRDGSGRVLRV